MKRKSWLSLVIILAGVVLLGIGIGQILSVKSETDKSLKMAKRVIAEKPQKDNNNDKNSNEPTPPPNFGDTLGILEIPRVNAELPIVEGTDPNDLKKGVGHYKGSSLPAEHGQIVLSGHRDTVFRRLGELKIGDSLIVKLAKGTYTYEITHMKIVDAKDTSIITLQKTEEELLLTTCYPFRYIGNAPKRYIIYAKPKSS
jgi:sortase A